MALVSLALVSRHFPDASPADVVGRSLSIDGTTRRIVGVAADVAQIFAPQPQPMVYVPFAQQPVRHAFLLVRTEGDPQRLSAGVRRAVAAVDPNQPIGKLQSFEAWQDGLMTGVRTFNVILGGFGTLALLLAAVGIYGVLAYLVGERTREIGIRMALGAKRSQVLFQVARQGLVLAGIGFLVGLPEVLLVTQMVASTLAEVGTVAPAAVVVLFAAVAAVASLVPARLGRIGAFS